MKRVFAAALGNHRHVTTNVWSRDTHCYFRKFYSGGFVDVFFLVAFPIFSTTRTDVVGILIGSCVDWLHSVLTASNSSHSPAIVRPYWKSRCYLQQVHKQIEIDIQRII